ncbi:hypothetical protein M422DRAFT_246352 [Sphaerobolus stellatus SS14]|nr:hypothetical protein M422DRAFT_246352 [Sphaerobolus stellatus SS14]
MPNTRSKRDNAAYQDAIVYILNEDKHSNVCSPTGHGCGNPTMQPPINQEPPATYAHSQGHHHGEVQVETSHPVAPAEPTVPVAWDSGGAGQSRGGERGNGHGHSLQFLIYQRRKSNTCENTNKTSGFNKMNVNFLPI